ncbi:MAG TPA: hypothetical protein VGI19_08500 [Candidatus Cybelea sp.]
MQTLSSPTRAFAVAALALLAACSQNTSPATPAANPSSARSVWPASFRPAQIRPAWMRMAPDGHRPTGLAVAEFGASNVFWYKANDKKNNPPKTCEPAESTNGIRIDRQGNLWVPNGISNTTTEYAPHCGAAKLTITDTTGEPADVGFDRHENVYILDLNAKNGAPGVNVYTHNGTFVRSLTDPSFHDPFGVNSDNHGNIYVSTLTTSNAGIVVEFPGGKMPGKQLSGVSLGLPGVPAFDSANNLVITDWEAYTIDIFAPPYTSAPTTTPLEGASIWCSLDHKQQHLYCGDADFGAIDVYKYPGATYLYSYTAGLSPSSLVTGVATDPPASYWKR